MTVVKSVSDGLRDCESETQLNLNRPLRSQPAPGISAGPRPPETPMITGLCVCMCVCFCVCACCFSAHILLHIHTYTQSKYSGSHIDLCVILTFSSLLFLPYPSGGSQGVCVCQESLIKMVLFEKGLYTGGGKDQVPAPRN